MSQEKLEPKLFSVFREGYSRHMLVKDLTAGIIVGIVALPLALAFAIASGVKPEQGLYTAIIAGFAISMLSGSRVQIGGPTGAFIVIIYGIIQRFGYDGLATATLIAGALLVIMGLARFGSIIKYIPYPVTVGFTSGIALIIFAGQVRDFLGLDMPGVPSEFIDKWEAYFHYLHTFNPYALGIGALALAIVIFWPRLTHRVPGSLVAIVVTSLLVKFMKLPVETIFSHFGPVSGGFPPLRIPSLSFETVRQVFSPAVSIALLAGIESLLSAVVADGMTGRRHRSNMELVAQGVANMVSPLFGGIPATGAIARTATNIKNGGQTPVAGMVHALTLLGILLFLGKWAALVPMPALAAILIVVAYNMSEWRLFMRLFKSPKSDVLVLLCTFVLTVFLDLVVAIQVGVVLASLLFMRRMTQVSQASYLNGAVYDEEGRDDPNSLERRTIPPGVEVFEIDGPFFFGAAEKFKHALYEVHEKPIVLILRVRKVLTIDATGLRALEDIMKMTRREGTLLLLSGVHAQPLIALQRSGLLDKLSEDNVFGNIDNALDRAREVMGLPKVEHPGPFVPSVAREMLSDE